MSAELQVVHGADRIEAINELILDGKFDRMSDFMREAVDAKLKEFGFDLEEYNPNFSKLKERRFRGNTKLVVRQLQKKKYQTVKEIHEEISKEHEITAGNIRRILYQLKDYKIVDFELKRGISNNQHVEYEMQIQHFFLI